MLPELPCVMFFLKGYARFMRAEEGAFAVRKVVLELCDACQINGLVVLLLAALRADVFLDDAAARLELATAMLAFTLHSQKLPSSVL